MNLLPILEPLRNPTIAALSNADAADRLTRTYRAVPLSELEEFLLRTGISDKLDAGAANQSIDAGVRAGITRLQKLIASPRLSNLGLDQSDIAQQVEQLGAVAVQLNVMTADDLNQLLALGRVNGVVDEATVAAARAAMPLLDQITALRDAEAQDHDRRVGAINDLQTRAQNGEAVTVPGTIGEL